MEKPVTEIEYFLAWVIMSVCGAIVGLIVGGVAGLILGALLRASGVDQQSITLICSGVGFLLGLPVSYAMFRIFVGMMIVKKAVVRSSSQIPEPPSFGQ